MRLGPRLRGDDPVVTAQAILTVLPLNDFAPAPVLRMQVVGEPGKLLAAREEMQGSIGHAEDRPVASDSLERFGFYRAARNAYAVAATAEALPYGCIIFKKGLIFAS